MCGSAWSRGSRHPRPRWRPKRGPPGSVLVAGARRGLPGGDAVLEIDPVAGGYPEQVGGAPDHVILELADLTVGVDQLPHHLDNAQSACLIHRTHDDAGEMIEINRLAFDQRR